MHRRSLLAGAAALPAAGLSAAALAQPANARVLKFVPQANLTSLDPIWTTAAVTMNHGYYVFDTLYGLDDALHVKPRWPRAIPSLMTAANGASACAKGFAGMTASRCARRTARRALAVEQAR